MQIEPRVILLEEPTQGVDVGARAGIVSRLRDAAAAGAGVLAASSDYGLLADLCDRVLILRDGVVVAELTGSSVTRAEIAARCYRSNGATS
jgi:ribose transport system ATP-binding protein